MSKIFIMNAPPRCGKDTIAQELIEKGGFKTAAFKYPLFNIFIHTTGMPSSEFFELYEQGDWKDTPADFLNGKSPRNLLQHISEQFIKPFFGSDYFGNWIADYIAFAEQDAEKEFNWVISDGGFKPELAALEKKFGDRVHVVQLEREGYRDFGTDTRGYVATDLPDNVHRYDTSGGNDATIGAILKIVGNS